MSRDSTAVSSPYVEFFSRWPNIDTRAFWLQLCIGKESSYEKKRISCVRKFSVTVVRNSNQQKFLWSNRGTSLTTVRLITQFFSGLSLWDGIKKFFGVSQARFLEYFRESLSRRNSKFSLNFGQFSHFERYPELEYSRILSTPLYNVLRVFFSNTLTTFEVILEKQLWRDTTGRCAHRVPDCFNSRLFKWMLFPAQISN